MLKQHTYMEMKYINSLGNKTKIQGISGGEEKQRGGKAGGAGGRETRCLSQHLFPSDNQIAIKLSKPWGVCFL